MEYVTKLQLTKVLKMGHTEFSGELRVNMNTALFQALLGVIKGPGALNCLCK